ncbi:MAG: 50S ribosomal protein L21 [Candidatus Harrisonbacteria bacterium]|nr:50S ribosomal protein L21 [Candidatus Harrisonbacteria bacterium]
MKYAVIEAGGKQYRVEPQKKIKIEKIAGDSGAEVIFDKVLLLVDGDRVEVGKPYVSGVKVTGKIVKTDRAKKLIVYKYSSKTRRATKKGHRQWQTEIEITSVV